MIKSLIVLGVGLGVQGWAGDLNVCDIVADLSTYSDKIVRVKGLVESDVDTWLTALSCPKELRIGEHVFRNILSLAWPDPDGYPHSIRLDRTRPDPDEFPLDKSSLAALRRSLLMQRVKNERIVVDLEGMIITRTPPYALLHPIHPSVTIGFGHMGMAPARILVKGIYKIEIKKVL